jgi:hypothetical protein
MMPSRLKIRPQQKADQDQCGLGGRCLEYAQSNPFTGHEKGQSG